MYQATHACHLVVQLYLEHTNGRTNKREGDLLGPENLHVGVFGYEKPNDP